MLYDNFISIKLEIKLLIEAVFGFLSIGKEVGNFLVKQWNLEFKMIVLPLMYGRHGESKKH